MGKMHRTVLFKILVYDSNCQGAARMGCTTKTMSQEVEAKAG